MTPEQRDIDAARDWICAAFGEAWDEDTMLLADLLTLTRQEATREAIESAAKALFERAHTASRDAKIYATREDGGDGSHESCLESAVTFMDAGALVRALAAAPAAREEM
jgi:hypothetical protein